jgi:hypothetical protein
MRELIEKLRDVELLINDLRDDDDNTPLSDLHREISEFIDHNNKDKSSQFKKAY